MDTDPSTISYPRQTDNKTAEKSQKEVKMSGDSKFLPTLDPISTVSQVALIAPF